ncbi:MAG: hypothetical protein AB1646_20745 [Thermodesulfobacteriota bacterium]
MTMPRIKWMPVGLALAVLVLVHGFSHAWPDQVPPGQPAQMSSRLAYDPNLADPYFSSHDWSYPLHIQEHPGGRFFDLSTRKRLDKNPPRLKHTAKCSSTYEEDHAVKFCSARLLDENMIDLVFKEDNASFYERLRVQIRSAMFTCQYWANCDVCRYKGVIWSTKRQKLTLDKKEYRKGDVIKGRIDFECLQENTDPRILEDYGKCPTTIKVSGVFKTIVE